MRTKSIYKNLLILGGIVLTITSCEKEYEENREYNITKNSVIMTDSMLATTIQKNLVDFYNHPMGMQITGQFSEIYDKLVSNGNIDPATNEFLHTQAIQEVLRYVKELEKSKNTEFQARAKLYYVQTVWLYINIFGTYPTDGLQGRKNPFPSQYDSIQDVYKTLRTYLDEAEILYPAIKEQTIYYRGLLGENLTYSFHSGITFQYDSITWNPLFEGIRPYGRKMITSSADLVNAMHGDPRLGMIADTSEANEGMPYGTDTIGNFVQLPEKFASIDQKTYIMSWSFVCFIQAQQYLAANNEELAKQWYYGGIYASFKESNTPGVEEFLNRPDIAWNLADAANQITIQGWIASAVNQEPWKGWFLLKINPIYQYPLDFLP